MAGRAVRKLSKEERILRYGSIGLGSASLLVSTSGWRAEQRADAKLKRAKAAQIRQRTKDKALTEKEARRTARKKLKKELKNLEAMIDSVVIFE